MVPILENFYWTIVLHHSASGFSARIPLLVVLYLVATGNQKPGWRFLTGVLAAHFALSWYLSVGVGGQVTPLALVSFTLFATCAWLTWADETPWKVLPDGGSLRYLAVVGYTLAFIWPFWKFLSWWEGPLFSPMAVLPHQTLAVLLILLAVTGRNAPVALLTVAGICSVILAVIDVVYAGLWVSILLPALALTAGATHFLGSGSVKPTEPVGKETTKPIEKTEDPEPDTTEERKQGGRKWNVR
ncbi:MAG: hypothetical protein JJU11_13305 [Candidatus Sumerlaeia bacterium]|nr:hypothetical protein [Candidatus Sumerlaeia bacterium]